MKLTAAQDSMGDAAAAILEELQSETSNMKVSSVSKFLSVYSSRYVYRAVGTVVVLKKKM